ncbi:hypothetical protein M514_11627 [Trichuris suis]|uniref:GIY-YIG domain-containing protein n=1 Tax=Trichuris suis TaxID=68888 RepID=A0A085N396_9BILA|nr:hypothetical protein M513_11627 [Trichuris suis]KFD63942.1 hypothetical protein M514_11627 [Trichuris suis]
MVFTVWFKGNRTLRSILRNDKVKVPSDQCLGVVYEIKCECSASYIGETGNTLAHRFQEHMKSLTKYKNALNRLNGGPPNTSRGRPPTLDPRDSMEQATQTSAVAQHAAQYTGQMQAKVLCRESRFMIRKIKEALYIKHNSNINRDHGTAVSDSWVNVSEPQTAAWNKAVLDMALSSGRNKQSGPAMGRRSRVSEADSDG